MGFLKDTSRGFEPDEEDNDPEVLEEHYQRLFMKIGRDFLTVEDFASIMQQVLDIVDPDNIENIDLWSNVEAVTLANDYRDLIKEGKSARMKHLDLIDLSED
jgi:hypothetical protein